jgi:hypothetical protein
MAGIRLQLSRMLSLMSSESLVWHGHQFEPANRNQGSAGRRFSRWRRLEPGVGASHYSPRDSWLSGNDQIAWRVESNHLHVSKPCFLQ